MLNCFLFSSVTSEHHQNQIYKDQLRPAIGCTAAESDWLFLTAVLSGTCSWTFGTFDLSLVKQNGLMTDAGRRPSPCVWRIKRVPPGSNWTRPAVLWVKSLPGLADPSSTCTKEEVKQTMSADSRPPGVWSRTASSYLDSDVRRVDAPPAALDLDLERPRRLTGSVAGRR